MKAHELANKHDMMTQITKAHSASSEQHVDLTPSRVSRDTVDCQKLFYWLNEHHPFKQSDKRIKSLSTGVIGVGLNCLRAEGIGKLIQMKLDNIPLSEAKISRKEAVIGFNDKISSVNIDNKSVPFNPILLFT